MCLQECLVHLLETALMAPQVTVQLRQRIVLTEMILLFAKSCPGLLHSAERQGSLTVPAKRSAKEA